MGKSKKSPKSAVSQRSGRSARSAKTQKVVIKTNQKVPEKKDAQATPTPQHEVTAPAPPVEFQFRDEVEMLRAGFKNKNGDAVKTQGQAMNIEL